MFDFYHKKKLSPEDKQLCEEIKALADSDSEIKEYLSELTGVQKVNRTNELRMLKNELVEQQSFIRSRKTTTVNQTEQSDIKKIEKPVAETVKPETEPVKKDSGSIVNPLSEPVIEREHNIQEAFHQKSSIPPVSQSLGGETTQGEPVFKDIADPFDQPLPQTPVDNTTAGANNQGNTGSGQETNQQTNEQGTTSEQNTADQGAAQDGFQGNPSLKDMDAGAKRKAFEQTADAIMATYGQYIPPIFAGYAKIDDFKFDKLVYEGKLDPRMDIGNGVSVAQWKDAANAQVDEVFVMSKETHESIREPLVEVLMENELALKPMHRLLIAVGMHVGSMGYAASQISKQNQLLLDTLSAKYRNGKATYETQSSGKHENPRQETRVHTAQEKSPDPDIDEFRQPVTEDETVKVVQPQNQKIGDQTSELKDDKLSPEEKNMANEVIAGMSKRNKK